MTRALTPVPSHDNVIWPATRDTVRCNAACITEKGTCPSAQTSFAPDVAHARLSTPLTVGGPLTGRVPKVGSHATGTSSPGDIDHGQRSASPTVCCGHQARHGKGGNRMPAHLTPAGPNIRHGWLFALLAAPRRGCTIAEGWFRSTTNTPPASDVDHAG